MWNDGKQLEYCGVGKKGKVLVNALTGKVANANRRINDEYADALVVRGKRHKRGSVQTPHWRSGNVRVGSKFGNRIPLPWEIFNPYRSTGP
jgi:hypothetical protein